MRQDLFYAMIMFDFVSGVTPGLNNTMLMSSGVNFGFRRMLPHLLGVVLGFSLMVVLIGSGLDTIFT
jgi:threonine/homoserine/homoserine lactone efflux protein